MTMAEPTAHPAAAGSPYLSLRRAVQPAIIAHSLLAADTERAGKLAAECEELLFLTRELLKAAGRTHLLGPPPGDEVTRGCVGGRPEQLLDAYADAGLLWAKVVGSSVSLAGALLRQGDWDEVRRLAGFFGDIGEENTARHLRVQLGNALWDAHGEQLQAISNRMPPEEIRRTINVLQMILREVPEEFPDRNAKVNRLLPPLATSIFTVLAGGAAGMSPDSRAGHIAMGGVAAYPDIVKMSLEELSAEFEAACD
jgi:hypothetical protein